MRRKHALTSAVGLGIAVALTFTMSPMAFSAADDAGWDDTARPGWELKYRELFTEADMDFDMDEIPWQIQNYQDSFDTMSDDDGQTFWADMGLGYGLVMRSFRTWEKTAKFGEDGWLKIALSGRQQDLTSGKNQPERPGVFHVIEQPETGNIVGEFRADDPTAGAFMVNAEPMPPVYRVQYTATRYEMGGDRKDRVTGEASPWTMHPGFEYGDDGEYSIEPDTPRYNGFASTDALGRIHCKSQHPWTDTSTNAYTAPRCSIGASEWSQAQTRYWDPLFMGSAGYNGFHALTVVDVQYPMPRNLGFWHYHRKVLMDQFATDRLRSNSGHVCNSETGVRVRMDTTDRNGVNPWVSITMNGFATGNVATNVGGAGTVSGSNTLQNYTIPANGQSRYGVGRKAGQGQYFFSDCNGSVADPDRPGRMIYTDTNQNAPRAMSMADPRFYPYVPYTFAVERTELGYTLEWSGMFEEVGWHTYRYYRPFILGNRPVWHYNAYPGDHYAGQWNGWAFSQVQQHLPDGRRDANRVYRTWSDIWHANSAYPDFVVMGVEYTNSTEGWVQFDDVRYYEPADNRPDVSVHAVVNVDSFQGVPQLDVEVINLEELASFDSITVETAFGTKTFAADYSSTNADDPGMRPDAHPNFRWKVDGSIPDGVAKVTATIGSKTGVIEVPYKGIDVPDVVVTTTTRCMANKGTLVVTATPAEDLASLWLTTPFGAKEFTDVAAGQTISQSFALGAGHVPAGEVTVTPYWGPNKFDYAKSYGSVC